MQKKCNFSSFCTFLPCFAKSDFPFSIIFSNFALYFQTAHMKKIIGLGNALTDILLQVSDDAIRALGISKGSMNHIDFETCIHVQEMFSTVRRSMIAGGSASNTLNAIASMGGKASFIGKIGNDEIGQFYRQNTQENGVQPILLPSKLVSGCCIALITPDGERTFCTYLGAAADLQAENITEDMFIGQDIFHVEGYLVQNHELIEKAIRYAKESGLIISLDLASFNVVNEHKEFLQYLVREYVDIVFANEDESLAYTNMDPESSVRQLAKECQIAVVKIGKRGSLVQMGEERYHIPAVCTNCIDSTGAGDYYAAGFLYGYAVGMDIKRCAELGTLTAGRVCEVLGAKLPQQTWQEIKGLAAMIQTADKK